MLHPSLDEVLEQLDGNLGQIPFHEETASRCFRIELLVILSLCGCWLRNQAQVGFLGAVMALGSLIAAGFLWFGQTRWALGQLLYGVVNPQSLVITWGYCDATGSYSDHELAEYLSRMS